MSEIICSYPRSGSTWLRFILCNLLYPDVEHDIGSVNRRIPDIDGEQGVREATDPPQYYKSHIARHAQRIIHLHRHVGDVLISEWWFKRKFYNERRPLYEFIVRTEYGAEWRSHADFFFPCNKGISFDQLSSPAAVMSIVPSRYSLREVEMAIERSSFARLQKVEESGFGSYPSGDPAILFFRDGRSGQWQELEEGLRSELLDRNYKQLKMLGYL